MSLDAFEKKPAEPAQGVGKRTVTPSLPTTKAGIRAGILAGEPSVHNNRVNSHCPPGYLTRNMLREKTGLSEAELRSLEARGRLRRAKKNNGGWALYPESIVYDLLNGSPGRAGKNMPVVYDGVQCADVFERLVAGKSRATIIIETKLLPAVVESIEQAYERATGSVVVSKETVGRLSTLFRPNFAVDTEEALFDMVEGAVKANTCIRCKQKPGRVCMGCTRPERKAADDQDAAEVAEAQSED